MEAFRSDIFTGGILVVLKYPSRLWNDEGSRNKTTCFNATKTYFQLCATRTYNLTFTQCLGNFAQIYFKEHNIDLNEDF